MEIEPFSALTEEEEEETSSLIEPFSALDEGEEEVKSSQMMYRGVPVSTTTPAAPEGPEPLTKEEFMKSGRDMAAVRKYMENRMGVQWEERGDDEVLDSFISHMRYVSTNELSTLGEWRYTHLEDENKKIAGAAYEAHDKLKSMFTSGDWGDVGEGAFDYAGAVLTSPLTYLGAGVGKVGTMLGGAAGKKAMMAGARTAFRAAAKTGGVAAGKAAAQKVIAQGAKKEAAAIIISGGVGDVIGNTYQDAMYQGLLMDSGAQDEYNWYQTAIAAAGGVVGAAIPGIPEMTRGVSGLSGAKKTMKATSQARASKAMTTIIPQVKASVAKLNKNVQGWMKSVKKGGTINPSLDEAAEFTQWFFNPADPGSIFRIVLDSGAKLNVGQDIMFTEELAKFARGLPANQLRSLNKALKPTGLTFGEMIDIVGTMERQSGTALGIASQAKQYAKKYAQVSAAKNNNNMVIVNLSGDILKPSTAKDAIDPDWTRYLTSVWRRLLVSHPATTAVNVLGWGQAYGARSLAEILHGGTLGTVGMLGKLAGRKWADKSLATSKSLFLNQTYKARTFLDPYESLQGFRELMKRAPRSMQDKAFKSFFGGVDAQDSLHHFGMIDPKTGRAVNKFVKGAEIYADWATRMSLIKAQDVWTKTMSGLGELDKVSRLKLNRGIDQVIRDGDEHLITDEMWADVGTALLKDTFSYDFTRGKAFANKLAKMNENISNTPGLGFIFPFARFMNNTIAFTFEYSPLSLLHMASKLPVKSGRRELAEKGAFNLQEQLAKATVGTVAFATLLQATKEAEEQGMQWYEQEESTGVVLNRQNLAPASVFALSSRIYHLMEEGEGVPPELIAELGMQLGPGQLARQLGGSNALTEVVDWVSGGATPDEKQDFFSMVGEVMASLSGQILSGYTRPIDPLNDTMGWATGTDVEVDKRQARTGLDALKFEMLRYTNNFFAPVLGSVKEEGSPKTIGETKRSATRPEGDIYDPNPVGALFGRKEAHGKNNIDKLLGMTNLPPFLFDQRTAVPEFDRFMNEEVAPLLDARAERLMQNKSFINAPNDVKVHQTKQMLNDVRKEIRERIEGGWEGQKPKVLNARRAWSSKDRTLRDEAKRALDISTPDDQLSEGQLIQLNKYLDYAREVHELDRQ